MINNSHSNLLKNRYTRQKIETFEIQITSYYKFLQIMGACSARGIFQKLRHGIMSVTIDRLFIINIIICKIIINYKKIMITV